MGIEQEQNSQAHNLEGLNNRELAEALSEKAFQSYVENIMKAYAYKVEANENVLVDPIAEDSKITDTEIMMFVNKLLDMRDIDVFELQMFRNFCIS